MITTYQIRNVLRVYGNQLKKNTSVIKDKVDPPRPNSETVKISKEAREKQEYSLNNNSGDGSSRENFQNENNKAIDLYRNKLTQKF